MNVLVACEFSGTVSAAFRARGHSAFSVDLLPTEGDPYYHLEGDALEAIRDGGPWDLLIAHPPCTYLALSGVRWLYRGGKRNPYEVGHSFDPERWSNMLDAANFFRALYLANVPRIAVENPRMHPYAQIGPPTQFIQPWQFGHGETKETGLWLRNLPPLKPTNIVDGREPRVHRASPGPTRWMERSRTLPGIADAMAEQWGSL